MSFHRRKLPNIESSKTVAQIASIAATFRHRLILCAVALRIENEQIAAADNIGQVRLRYTGNGGDDGIGGIPVAVWLLLKIGKAFSMRSVFILCRPRFLAHQCKAAQFGQLQDMPPEGSR